jgi:fluoride exporter
MLLSIAAGGGVGALARFAVGGWVTTWAGAAFPWPTFLVNVAGSALLGFLIRRSPAAGARPTLSAGLTTGFCGGFTTFSTFDYETLLLLQAGRYARAVAYAGASVAACVVGVALGLGVQPRRRPPDAG